MKFGGMDKGNNRTASSQVSPTATSPSASKSLNRRKQSIVNRALNKVDKKLDQNVGIEMTKEGSTKRKSKIARNQTHMITPGQNGSFLVDDESQVFSNSEEKVESDLEVEKSPNDWEGKFIEEMMKETDPSRRHILSLKLKQKQMEQARRKPLPQLSFEQRGWNAPQDQPYVPVGRMTELVSAVEQVRQNLPNTRDRFQKNTYRQMLVIKKRERDHADQFKKIKQSHQVATSKGNKDNPLNQSTDLDKPPKMHDSSRVVSKILPEERDTLVRIRNYNYESTVLEAHRKRQSMPAGPRLNKFGRLAAGFVAKKSEIREEKELIKKQMEEARLSASPSVIKKQKPQGIVVPEAVVVKSDIELQMEAEKKRGWIRKRNGKIYDEKIKDMILTTDNGSSLLKQEIQESEVRLNAVKLGRPLDEVVPAHNSDYFLTNKEDYFRGAQRILRRQERDEILKKKQVEEVEEPQSVKGNDFQTIINDNDDIQAGEQGFFLTEQPMTEEEQPYNSRKNMIRVPDLLQSKDTTLEDEQFKIQEMFYHANDNTFEKVYRAKTSQVKGLYLKRLQSRQIQRSRQQNSIEQIEENSGRVEGKLLKHQRANSLSTAAATTRGGFYLSGMQKGARQSEAASYTINSNLESDRLMSAMTQIGQKNSTNWQGKKHKNRYIQPNVGSGIFLQSAGSENMMGQAGNQTVSIVDTAKYDSSKGLDKQLSGANSPQCRSQITFNARNVLKDAKHKRAKSVANALQKDVSNQRNRVRYLQNLQKQQMDKKKLDHVQGSNIFEGFSKEEINEILIEMPELKKMQKEQAMKAKMGPKPPQFSNINLIHLDSLNDIANKGQADLRYVVMEQIDQRKSTISKHIDGTDLQYQMDDPSFIKPNLATSKSNMAILKKFQQSTNKDGIDEFIPTNYNFHASLKQRLNFIDARQQAHMYETFKEEDFVHKVWQGGPKHHNALDSERAHHQSGNGHTVSQRTMLRSKTLLTGQLSEKFNEHPQQSQASLMQSGSNQNSQPQIRKQQTSLNQYMNIQQTLQNQENQQQINEEMLDYDHSDQQLLMKIIEVYENRKRLQERLTQAAISSISNLMVPNLTLLSKPNLGFSSGQQININTSSRGQLLKRQASKNSKGSSMQVAPQDTVEDYQSNGGQMSNLDESVTRGLPAKTGGKPPTSSRPIAKTNSRTASAVNSEKGSKSNQQLRSREKLATGNNQNIGSSKVVGGVVSNDKRKALQMKKDYKKFVIKFITSEGRRAQEALISCTDEDLDKVISCFTNKILYKESKEFIVTNGKFMTEDHLIHLKDDPKTILSLYRMFMLFHKTNQLASLENKPTTNKKKPKKDKKEVKPFDKDNVPEVESDYSDSDFQDLMSNKQIEENIKVFFDRMHELVNPIDQTRLKLDSVQQIKTTVKTFYRNKAKLSDKLLQELDQMSAERPVNVQVKQQQFNDPDGFNQANLHADRNDTALPTQQMQTRMTDIRLNAELFRLRKFKDVAHQTSFWYNDLAACVLAAKIQDEPLVVYMLDQIKHVIEIGECFTRTHFHKLMETFDEIDGEKPEVIKLSEFLNELLPHSTNNDVNNMMNYGEPLDSKDYSNQDIKHHANDLIKLQATQNNKNQRSKVVSKVTFEQV